MTRIQTVRQARNRFLHTNGFTTAEYAKPWVTFKFGILPVAFPNLKARQRAVPLHDLHHVATGYQTDVRGEAELAAWELAAGCGVNYAALLLNTMAALTGLVIAPVRVTRAFRRGRKGRTLYRLGGADEFLDMGLGELRALIGVEQ